jgi:hypothetical protein
MQESNNAGSSKYTPPSEPLEFCIDRRLGVGDRSASIPKDTPYSLPVSKVHYIL